MPFRRIIDVIALFTAALATSCTGPHLWIECDNDTGCYAALSLRRLDADETFVTVADPHDYGEIDINISGGFSWMVKLYDRDVMVYCDSGEQNLDTDNDLCRIAETGNDSFIVTWLDR
jgi:hypothetical protein